MMQDHFPGVYKFCVAFVACSKYMNARGKSNSYDILPFRIGCSRGGK